jgi:hypothetical protein
VTTVPFDPHCGRRPGAVHALADGERRAMLPRHFVTVLEMSALDHMRMGAAVQPFVDASISKTVNVPSEYPFADFEPLPRRVARRAEGTHGPPAEQGRRLGAGGARADLRGAGLRRTLAMRPSLDAGQGAGRRRRLKRRRARVQGLPSAPTVRERCIRRGRTRR